MITLYERLTAKAEAGMDEMVAAEIASIWLELRLLTSEADRPPVKVKNKHFH